MGFWSGANQYAEIYVDLGTANTLVVSRRKGLIINEPSVIAYRSEGEGRKTILAVGNEAKEKIGRTPGNVVACHPLKDGVIADLDIAESMLRYFLEKAKGPFQFRKPRVVISLPFDVSDVETKAIKRAGEAAGASEVLLIHEPMAAAVGAGLPVGTPKGNMVIDIGGGTTEVAIISLYGIVHCETVRVGGHAFDQAIVNYMRRRYNLIVGENSAEKLKIELGSAVPFSQLQEEERFANIRGLDHVSGLPRSVTVTSSDVLEALQTLLQEIVEAGKRALEKTPPELMGDIIKEGIVVAGGGALLRNIDKRFQKELGVPVRIDNDPLLTIARGGEAVIKNPKLLDHVIID